MGEALFFFSSSQSLPETGRRHRQNTTAKAPSHRVHAAQPPTPTHPLPDHSRPQVDTDRDGLLNAGEIAKWAQSNGATVGNASSSSAELLTFRDVYNAAPETLRAPIVTGEAERSRK